MAKRQRICPECLTRGITAYFENGNELRHHRRARHPKTKTQIKAEREALSVYRRRAILAAARGTVED